MRALLLLVLCSACDPQVKSASGGATQAQVAPVAQEEPPPRTSRLGDYYWAAGDLALTHKDVVSAVEHYQQALGQFEAEKIEAPAGLLCSYGRALRQKVKDPKAGEQAARVLHRCVLAARPGSPEYRAGMTELAELEAQGLDPALLARDQPAEIYLTRTPKKVVPDKPVLELQATTSASDKGFQAFMDALRQYEPQFARCWSDYVAATQKTSVAVLLNLKYRQILGDDDIVVGAKLEVTPAAGVAGPEAAASQCVRDALAPTVAEFGKNTRLASGNWNGVVTVVLRQP